MSNPIPPFVCSTPPPIDCIADAPPPLVEDDFGDFAVVDDHQFEVSSLPVTPVHVAKLPDVRSSTDKIDSLPTLSNAVFDFPLKDDKEGATVDINSFEHDNSSFSPYPPPAPSKSEVKDDLPYIIEANSPPPFEYAPDDDELPPCDELEDDEEVDEFPADDDMGKYDDNISLPSLKFDSLSIHSKSTTPVSEELTKPKLEESETIPIVDEVTNSVISEINLTEDESTEKLSTPDEELNTIPIETLNIRDELEKCHDIVVTSVTTNEEQDDDFAEFETFPAPSVSNDINQTDEEPPDGSDTQTKEVVQEKENITEPIFEADFSQFSSFATEVVPPLVSSQIIENSKLIEKSTLDDLEADDFDDFQDFTVNTNSNMEQRKASVYSASSEVEVVAEEPSEATKNSDQDDDNDDDDFGEFSEVVECNEASSIPSSNSGFNLANLNDKLKPILEMMFPVANPSEEEPQDEYTPSSLNDLNQLTAISQIDTAKALEHQWINSEVRHSLIKSLGVDSRNILYGEKWNSSMPRFAANLSFNPLEPMKPDKAANSVSNDYRKRSENQTSVSTTTKIDVPAVEFDWNSSGLVNPLDASQAHTLLLDLDQLVVVANLDKINLDSSRSSPCFATPSPSLRSSSSSLISTLQTTTKTDVPAMLLPPPPPPNSITLKQPSHTDDLLAIDVKQPRTKNIDLITMSSTPSLSSSSSSMLLPPPPPPCNPSIFVTGTCRTKKCLNDFDKPTNDYVTNANFTTTTTTTNIFANLGSNDHNFNQYLDFRVKEILHERTIEAVHSTQPGESNASTYQQSSSVLQSNNNNNNNIYDTDKSLRCFINDEEAISTPIEFKSNADAPVAISTTTTAATIITTPTTLSGDDYIDITCGDFQPSVLETDLDTVTFTTSQELNHHNITHSAKYQESLKTDLETESQHSGVVSTSTYAGPLKETHIFTPSKGESVQSSRSSTSAKISRTSESKCPIDFDYEIAAAGIIIDETVVKKEYRDVEYNPGFGSKYREDTIENTIHRLSPEGGSSKISYLGSENVNRILDKPHNQLDESSDLQDKLPEKKNSFVPKSNSFDEEFSDFQSVPPAAAPVPVPVPALATSTTVPSTSTIIPSSAVADPKTSPSHWRVLKETSEVSSLGSRTGTPVSLSDEMILCPAILLPQAIQMEHKPKIEWPEPGINPEELARIEELFPQPKGSGSNKPSPSHSGRSQQQLGGSNRATPQLGAADDDDWSDFVSVPAAASNHIQSISQQFQKRQISPAKSMAEPNNDEEWSDFVSSAPHQHPNNMRPSSSIYPQFNSASWQNANFYNNPMSAYASPPTSFYYQPPAPPQKQQQQHHQQQNLSNNLVPNLSNVNNNTAPAANSNIINNNSINQYLINNQANHLSHHHQQHIQMMRDFSSASPMDGGSISSAAPSMHQQYPMQIAPGYGYNRVIPQQHGKSSQFGSGSSKIAPSISLIPDLGFVAPAHTSFISVPKNSFATKK